MPFEKGKPKTGGRQPGSTNKATTDIKAKIVALIEDRFDDIKVSIELLDPKDQVAAYLRFLEYVLPKQREQKIDLSSLTEEQVDDLLNKAINKLDDEP